MNKDNRPLSPHLQVYKPQLTSMMSIMHRATGYALAVGTLLVMWWLTAAASGLDSYMAAMDFTHSIFGKLLLLGWSFSLFYHLYNGIRHLFWDMGYLFKLKNAYAAGYAVWALALISTVVVWICA